MPRSLAIPTRSSPALTGQDELEAVLARTMPVVLALLADGTPRSKRAIVAALADRHDRQHVGYAVTRLAVTGGIVERQERFVLASDEDGESPTVR